MLGLGLGLTKQRGKGVPPIISATVNPLLGALAVGDQVQDGLSTGALLTSNYASTAGTISTVTAAVTVNGSAGALTDVVAALDVVSVSITVTDSAANERVYYAGAQTVPGVAPSLTASDSLTVDELTITVDSVTGDPEPTTSLTSFLLDGASVIGDVSGGSPTWTYFIPDGSTVTWTVTASNGVSPDATDSGSATYTASDTAPATMSAPTLTGGTEAATLALATPAPDDGGSTITSYEYQVDLAAGDFSSPTATGTQTPANLGNNISLSPLTAGDYKARSRAINAIGAGAWSAASTTATVASSDATAPVVNSDSYTSATRTLAINITEASGLATLYGATVANPNTPSKSDIENNTGNALDVFTQVVTDGAGSYTISGLTDETADEIHYFLRDAAGNESAIEILTGVVVDATAPTVSTLSPADNATGVAVDANLVMTFSESMARQGTVTLKTVGGATIQTFDLSTDGTWSTVSATDDRITLNPTADLSNSAEIAVQWSGLEDTYGNALANNATDTAWNFTVVSGSYTAPTIDNTGTGYFTKTGGIATATETAMTFSGWINYNALIGGSHLIEGEGGSLIRVTVNQFGTLLIFFTWGTATFNESLSSAFTAGTEKHLYISVNAATDTLLIYLDNTQIMTTASAAWTSTTGEIPMNETLRIFTGNVEASEISDVNFTDIMLFNSVVPVADLYNGGTPPDPSTLAATPLVLFGGTGYDATDADNGVNGGSAGAFTSTGTFGNI